MEGVGVRNAIWRRDPRRFALNVPRRAGRIDGGCSLELCLCVRGARRGGGAVDEVSADSFAL